MNLAADAPESLRENDIIKKKFSHKGKEIFELSPEEVCFGDDLPNIIEKACNTIVCTVYT